MRVTVATRDSRPVDSACSSMLDAAIRVVISASAATPAPQQLREGSVRELLGSAGTRDGNEGVVLGGGELGGGMLTRFWGR